MASKLSDFDRVYNDTLVPYKRAYRTERMGDGVLAIRCKHGCIVPYSVDGKQLAFVYILGSTRGKNNLLASFDGRLRIVQSGDSDFVGVFPISALVSLESVLKIRKRKQYTEEELVILRERAKKMIAARPKN